MTYTIDIRQRRQTTIPSAVLAQLGITIGDSLEIQVTGKTATLTPKKQVALDALAEIQKSFKESRIPMSTFIKNADKQRLEVAKSFSEK